MTIQHRIISEKGISNPSSPFARDNMISWISQQIKRGVDGVSLVSFFSDNSPRELVVVIVVSLPCTTSIARQSSSSVLPGLGRTNRIVSRAGNLWDGSAPLIISLSSVIVVDIVLQMVVVFNVDFLVVVVWVSDHGNDPRHISVQNLTEIPYLDQIQNDEVDCSKKFLYIAGFDTLAWQLFTYNIGYKMTMAAACSKEQLWNDTDMLPNQTK